jgi:hypothetical protein
MGLWKVLRLYLLLQEALAKEIKSCSRLTRLNEKCILC